MQLLHRFSKLSKLCRMVVHPGLALTVKHQPIDRIQLLFELCTSDGFKPHMQKKRKEIEE